MQIWQLLMEHPWQSPSTRKRLEVQFKHAPRLLQATHPWVVHDLHSESLRKWPLWHEEQVFEGHSRQFKTEHAEQVPSGPSQYPGRQEEHILLLLQCRQLIVPHDLQTKLLFQGCKQQSFTHSVQMPQPQYLQLATGQAEHSVPLRMYPSRQIEQSVGEEQTAHPKSEHGRHSICPVRLLKQPDSQVRQSPVDTQQVWQFPSMQGTHLPARRQLPLKQVRQFP